MDLSELTAHAEEKFNIHEEYKWSDFPWYSVLTDPVTGKWVALLMRFFDSETGEEIQRCDLKCGQQTLKEYSLPYLSMPFRMKGQKWIGISFDKRTDRETVFRLFDRAVRSGDQRGYTIMLGKDLELKIAKERQEASLRLGKGTGLVLNVSKEKDEPIQLNIFKDTALPFKGRFQSSQKSRSSIPDIFKKMAKLYKHGDGSVEYRNRNFYLQGKLMENYEDDLPWNGQINKLFTTYHDLDIRQLRGYFTWRTRLRKGEYQSTCDAFAYIYLYELLCCIGTKGPEDSLEKMMLFKKEYVGKGFGSPGLERNIARWLPEFAVIHGLPSEKVLRLTNEDKIKGDEYLCVLLDPMTYSDQEVFDALAYFGGKKLLSSPVACGKFGEAKNAAESDEARILAAGRGKKLFVSLWRYASASYKSDPNSFAKTRDRHWAKAVPSEVSVSDLFTECFGVRRAYPWHPLSNAIHYEEHPMAEWDLVLDGCRTYRCRQGKWTEERFETLYFNKDLFFALLHEGERLFRKYLKAGSALKEKDGESWVTPFAETVIALDKKAVLEASKPVINIDFSGLEKIREDAAKTRDSLLTEDEMDFEKPKDTMDSSAAIDKAEAVSPAEDDAAPKAGEESSASGLPGLDARYEKVLRMLLSGEDAAKFMKDEHIMPSVAADAINEYFYDDIGDSVILCDSDALSIADEYIEDLLFIIGGIE